MARALPPHTWENGFKKPVEASATPWVWKNEDDDPDSFVTPPSKELLTSTAHNNVGINVIRTWPTLFDGTNNPHGTPDWWKPAVEVDVLIVGAGPSGLEVALSLARQGVSFRIIDKAPTPLTAGRADGVQPRFLETVATWGLASEIAEEGPLIERTAIYLDGKKLLFNRSHQCDSRYRGLHVITQGQIERIFIRDLARHKALVERERILSKYTVEEQGDYPVRAMVRNERTGEENLVRAKYLVGSDGAASTIRKSLSIPFDGVSTDIYWGIMDCVFETDYPHAWVFGSVISSKHGGCVIIPREDGYIRLYTQLDVSQTGPIAAARQQSDASFAEAGGRVEIETVTPEEVLEQANRIFAPYKLKFAAPLSWFAIWKISERVARSYSSPDTRVHLVGDAAHVHSVMGAFGLNASILDAANLAWKLGLAAKNLAKPDVVLPTYSLERREHAVRVIEVSGTYLRFVTGSAMPVPNLRNFDGLESRLKTNGHQTNGHANGHPNGHTNGVNGHTNGTGNNNSKQIHIHVPSTSESSDSPPRTQEDALQFLGKFFQAHGQFLLGVDCPYATSPIAPQTAPLLSSPPPVRLNNGVRAPNPRLCFSDNHTGYLYDLFEGPPKFHIVVFGSSLKGRQIRDSVDAFSSALSSSTGFWTRYGGQERFTVTVVIKRMPFEVGDDELLNGLEDKVGAKVVFDDRQPDEDVHTTYGANHSKGGVVVIRPDLWVGVTAFPDEMEEKVGGYFDGFLLPV
ncbi:FAD binding domain-containing protein [Triangularia verruculosa]|uniref:FAD binding domain-containing protein n=1 Tax=Triangularia verruculosa TaxID=2587418 RepID=A0AAN7ARB2_9PEZI|nr:FAD binding domain-containing protein [Triangularia verruculosa]